MAGPNPRRPSLFGLASVLVSSTIGAVGAFSLRMSAGAADFANMALRQAPSSTQFYTNKMCPFGERMVIVNLHNVLR